MAAFARAAFSVTAFSPSAFAFDAAAQDDGDTHDGFDEDSHRLVKEEQSRKDKEFLSKRQRAREILTQAWAETHPGPVAAEVKALAAPYVERLESGSLRVDYKALQRQKALDELLAFQDALREEFQARIRAFEDDEEDVMILTLAL